MPLGAALYPTLEVAIVELDDPVALGADEMMVVLVAAEPVAELPGMVGERVDHALFGEDRERPVHGREGDVMAPGP